jgi:hypothetical protein
MIKSIDLRVEPRVAATPTELRKYLAKACDISIAEINDYKVVRRTIDARQRRVMVEMAVEVAIDDDSEVKPLVKKVNFRDVHAATRSVVIVGAGPAGLFAALRALELGLKPIVLERGADVDRRRLALAQLSRTGEVDPNTNYCFGEGGAGAYSDGKLYTRSKKRGDVREVLNQLVLHGASEEILVDAHPHIGSDKLPLVIKNIRKNIISHGGEVHFDTQVTNLLFEDGFVKGVVTASGSRFEGVVILATGHSARDVYRMLYSSNIRIEAKGLAIGVRLEHPQHIIDCIQYHSAEGRGKYLPAATYSLVAQSGGRGVYSFCMCPGGVIVPAASAAGEAVVNGMSSSHRSSPWANSGMVVEVHPGDVPGYSQYGELEMLELQQDLERRFYEESGSTLNAPAQRMTDFVAGRMSSSLPTTSYIPGIHSARIDKLLPEFIATRLADGLRQFGRRRQGFLTDKATLIGLESRTSSPVRIPRCADTLMHVDMTNLYPAGEGAGYAGGIVSAAVDGRRCVDAYFSTLNQE